MVNKSGRWLVGMGISIVAFGAVLWGVRLDDVALALAGANYGYLFPSIALLLVGLIARANCWRALLGNEVPLSRCFEAINAGYLLNNVLPLRLGELGRAYFVSRGGRVAVGQALSTVVVERLMDLVASVALLSATLPYALSAPWAPRVAVTTIVIVVAFYVVLFSLARNRDRSVLFVERVLERLPVLRTRVRSKEIASFVNGLGVLQDGRRLARAAFWLAIFWAQAGVQAWLILKMFAPDAPLVAGFFVIAVGALGAAVPSSPSALGVYEASVVAALLVFQYPQALGLSYAIVLHGVSLVLTSLLGGLALAREGESFLALATAARAFLRRPAESPHT